MNRRDAIKSTGGMVVAASLTALACAAQQAVAAAPATPAAPPPTPTPTPASAQGAATEAAFDCVKKGEACIAHCLALLSTGDTTMAECAAAAHDMVAAAQALAVIGSSGSKHIAAAARLALEACTDCEAACRKHADKHVICRECADSCARTVAACRALV